MKTIVCKWCKAKAPKTHWRKIYCCKRCQKKKYNQKYIGKKNDSFAEKYIRICEMFERNAEIREISDNLINGTVDPRDMVENGIVQGRSLKNSVAGSHRYNDYRDEQEIPIKHNSDLEEHEWYERDVIKRILSI